MPYNPIIGTLGYVMSSDKTKILLVHRIGRDDDDHLGKYNGLGGKMEPNEDTLSCIKREIREEAGIECVDVLLRGIINWTGFGPKGEDWLCFIYRIDAFEGVPYQNSPEGPLEWVDLNDLSTLPMWDGDRHFLPLIFDNDPSIFHGYMPYRNDTPLDWSYHRSNGGNGTFTKNNQYTE